MTRAKRKRYSRRVWGGFVGGRIDRRIADLGQGGWGQQATFVLAIFTSRAEARRHYQDVRPVDVREIRP